MSSAKKVIENTEERNRNEADLFFIPKAEENHSNVKAEENHKEAKAENSSLIDEVEEIPVEILNLAKKYTTYEITSDIFIKYKFFKKYCYGSE